jgi:uncharacterized protein YgiB involved in biofilm formation
MAGCEEAVREPGAQDARVYASVAECAQEHPAKACQDGWDAAETERTTTAPLFSTRADCEAQWGSGDCQPTAGPKAGLFAPAMAGFMLATMAQPQRRPCGPGTGQACDSGGASGAWGSGGGSGGAHAVYIGQGGKVYAGWETVGQARSGAQGRLAVPRTVTVVEAPGGRVSPGITTRGGFGRIGAFFGGHGG